LSGVQDHDIGAHGGAPRVGLREQDKADRGCGHRAYPKGGAAYLLEDAQDDQQQGEGRHRSRVQHLDGTRLEQPQRQDEQGRHDEHGQAALALKQYQVCRDALQDELGVRPDADTERLYQAIREKRAAGTGTRPPALPGATPSEPGPLVDKPPPHEEAATASDRPSIAVLPFENLSGDPEQQYFSDGITEDIITALSRVKWLFVIARNSSFTYKGRMVDVAQVARELGVRYVLEGSVRKAGGRVRITGQLIEAETARHIWAGKFDGELADVFDLQDQMTASVVAAVEPSLRQAEIDRARRKPTERLDDYDCYLRALPHFYTLTRAGRKALDQEAAQWERLAAAISGIVRA